MRDTSNVVRFPIRRARPGGVFCKPLNIYFPALHRTVQTVTADDLVGMNAPPEMEPLDQFVDYTLDPDQQYFGVVEHKMVKWIVDPDFSTLVIRYHASMEAAGSYLTAVSDIHGSEAFDPVFSTDDGLFTLTRRPTEKSWPGPMVIYVAEYFNAAGWQQWQIGVAPNGNATEADYL